MTENTINKEKKEPREWWQRFDEYLERRKKEIGGKRIFYFLSIFLFCFVTLFFILPPSLKVNIECKVPGEGTVQLYYKDSDTDAPEFLNRKGETGIITLNDQIELMSFLKLPAVINIIRMDVKDLPELTIKKMQVSLFDIPIKTYQGETLKDSMLTHCGMQLTVDGKDLTIQRNGDVAYFMLKRQRYMSSMVWILYVLCLMVISSTLAFTAVMMVPKANYWVRETNIITAAMAMLVISELITGNYWYISLGNRIVNFLILYILYRVVTAVFSHRSIGITLCNIFVLIFGITNYFLTKFRNKPLMPGDLSAMSTAKEVAAGYRYTVTVWMIFGVAMILFMMVVFGKVCKNAKKPKRVPYLLVNVPVVLVTIVILCIDPCFTNMKTYYWNNSIVNLYRTQGAAASYLKFQQAMKITEPKGYSVGKVKDIMKQLEAEDETNTASVNDNVLQTVADGQVTENAQTSQSEDGLQLMSQETSKPVKDEVRPTNVIMIMNESFSDLSVLGNQLGDTTVPYFRSLTDHTIWGNMYVSVRGGGTCNTEFETLTGNSLAFLPANTYPYQNYIKSNISSLAQYFRDQSYSATGMHLQNPTNWNRKFVYPFLGFEKFLSIDDYENMDTLRDYPTDKYNFEKVREQYEKNAGTDQFIFNVTMQNHGGYTSFKDVMSTVDLSEHGQFPTAELYLTLTKKSEDAFKEMLDYYSKVDEPTMIIMYGDHQPSLGNDVDDWLTAGTGPDEGLNHLNRYVTPFVIWTNYKIKGQHIERMSANYMSTLIMKTGNFELPLYNQLIWKVFEKYPVLSQEGIVDADGTYYQSINELKDDQLLQDYNYLEYNNLFDKKNREDSCFELKAE